MSIASFCGRHPLVVLLSASLFVCGSAAIAGTKIQLDMDSQVQANPANPHRLPDDMNPRLIKVTEEVIVVKNEAKEELAEVTETIHSLAFQGNRSAAQPTLDYTTGTSN
jgi:hypothetical protein